MRLTNTIPGVAASTRVGNLIGLRSAVLAKQASHASAILSMIMGTIVMVILIVTKDVSDLSNVWHRGPIV